MKTIMRRCLERSHEADILKKVQRADTIRWARQTPSEASPILTVSERAKYYETLGKNYLLSRGTN